MAIDTPATIAVLGAGPIGLEAALYARYLGYDVHLLERGRVAEQVLAWGHVRMFSPFRLNRSPLALAALRAQNAQWQRPDDEALLTGREYAERLLLPLSQTDLLFDSLHEQTEVVAIGRDGPLKGDLVGDESRGDGMFRLLLRTTGAPHGGNEQVLLADVVIDASGTYGQHNWAGQGGVPAVGELAAAEHIDYQLPDPLGRDRQRFSGRHVLVVGSGYSAATTMVALDQLARESLDTTITWVTRPRPGVAGGPVRAIADDRLPERARLTSVANRLATDQSHHVTYWPDTELDAIQAHRDPERFTVKLLGAHAGEIEVDRIVANVGFRPDRSFYEELQVHECYATGGPMRLAQTLMKTASTDCLDQAAVGAESLLTPEPNFYLLGAKSYGRRSQFLIAHGLEQIRELFTIVGDRRELNLYASMGKLAE